MSMKSFLDEHFLLNNKTAQHLYHTYAKHMPVIDYHCHLSPQQIAEDHQFQNLTQVWLAGDHYKWRAMRTNGVDESYCTGNKTDKEKFEKFYQSEKEQMFIRKNWDSIKEESDVNKMAEK